MPGPQLAVDKVSECLWQGPCGCVNLGPVQITKQHAWPKCQKARLLLPPAWLFLPLALLLLVFHLRLRVLGHPKPNATQTPKSHGLSPPQTVTSLGLAAFTPGNYRALTLSSEGSGMVEGYCGHMSYNLNSYTLKTPYINIIPYTTPFKEFRLKLIWAQNQKAEISRYKAANMQVSSTAP